MVVDIIVGTYEELVLGYSLCFEGQEYKFSTSFTDHSHTASVRTVAVNVNGIAASGSADETIKLFDTNKRVEIGSLLHHEGAVTGLKFFGKSHLFSFSDDGNIAIWRVGSWECLRTLKGHKSAVYSLSVHPSGKLALSCGKDKTLRTWNLITGRCAFVTNLKQAADIVLWSLDGSRYVVVAGNAVDVYSAESATINCSINVANRVSAAIFISDKLLALGCEKGFVYIYDLSTEENVCTINSETNRVKSLAVFNVEEDSSVCLALASSDGLIKVYQIDTKNKPQASLMAEHNTGFRLLCITAYCGKDAERSKLISTQVADVGEKSKNGDLADSNSSRQKTGKQRLQQKKEQRRKSVDSVNIESRKRKKTTTASASKKSTKRRRTDNA